ncbi:MAG: transposase, partial [Planctomycetes bacterium]|nr:transposase [Planctomycetota bacterium]
ADHRLERRSMPISRDFRERLEDDILYDRRITGSMYCANCGYNLKTLPRVYTCPECGSSYNARRQPMEGIFFPSDAEPPISAMAWALGCSVLAILLLVRSFNPFREDIFFVGLIFGVLAVCLIYRASGAVGRFLKFRALAKDIIRRQAEEDD